MIEKENKRIEIDEKRNLLEKEILKNSGFQLIFPLFYDKERMEVYSKLLKLAKDL